MRSLLVLCALAAPAFGDPDIRKDIDARIAADAKLRPIDPTTKKPVKTWKCTNGLVTDTLVSWSCEGRSDDDFTDLVAGVGVHRAFWIQGDKLVPLDLFAEVTSKDALKAAFELHHSLTACDPLNNGWGVTAKGLLVYARPDGPAGCTFDWVDVYRALKRDGALARIVRTIPGSRWAESFNDPWLRIRGKDQLPQVKEGKTAPGRFVAEGDYGVKDTQTGLVWTAKQGTTDVDATDAGLIAATYRGGGHTDWRLPTIDELVALATPDIAHTEPGDCTGGKSKYTITPLIHLSCGLAWSLTSTVNYNEYAAFGFISGTPRIAKGSESKNYRALLVRSP